MVDLHFHKNDKKP